MRMLREDRWPAVEFKEDYILDFYNHLQGKRQRLERIVPDELYFAARHTKIRGELVALGWVDMV